MKCQSRIRDAGAGITALDLHPAPWTVFYPAQCDLANLMGTGFDGLVYDDMIKLVETAAKDGRWLVFVGHEIGPRAHQSTDAQALEQLCRYAKDPKNGIWIDTVEKVGQYVKSRRG